MTKKKKGPKCVWAVPSAQDINFPKAFRFLKKLFNRKKINYNQARYDLRRHLGKKKLRKDLTEKAIKKEDEKWTKLLDTIIEVAVELHSDELYFTSLRNTKVLTTGALVVSGGVGLSGSIVVHGNKITV